MLIEVSQSSNSSSLSEATVGICRMNRLLVCLSLISFSLLFFGIALPAKHEHGGMVGQLEDTGIHTEEGTRRRMILKNCDVNSPDG